MPAAKLDAVFSAAESRARMAWGVSMTDVQWWRGAVIYQIYPRSFLDTDGDGVGDLPGIIERLDYVASLGVDGVWISRVGKSKMAEVGDDMAD
jgi:alpha-glucosidase